MKTNEQVTTIRVHYPKGGLRILYIGIALGAISAGGLLALFFG